MADASRPTPSAPASQSGAVTRPGGAIKQRYSTVAGSASSSSSNEGLDSILGPGLLPGVLPAIPDGVRGPVLSLPDKDARTNAATATYAAGVRAFAAQAVAFYFRAPAKAFFRTRVDYLAHVRDLIRQQHELQTSSGGGTPVKTSQNGAARPATGSVVSQVRAWLRMTPPFVLSSAIRHYGWRVVPEQALPPFVANLGAGAVLYTAYLAVLAQLHAESGRASRRVYPPPEPWQTGLAGGAAGAIQSVVAAPLDAVVARYEKHYHAGANLGWQGLLESEGGNGAATAGGRRPKSIIAFGSEKLREIGVRGIFAGWGLSFTKDTLGNALFFGVFEYVKAQSYYRFVTWYYGSLDEDTVVVLSQKRPRQGVEKAKGLHTSTYDGREAGGGITGPSRQQTPKMPTIITPHYAIEPMFLLLAGITASVTQQVVIHPLTHVQVEHWERLEAIDEHAKAVREGTAPRSVTSASSTTTTPGTQPPQRMTWRTWRWGMLGAYSRAYAETWAVCKAEAAASGLGLRRWLYRGFLWNTVRQVPSTSAGLIIFELVRRKYGFGGDKVRISRDGYDILLD